ncbi:MAG: EAL domain-containing protein [Pseudomonadales bacterium]|nr:EAL domain-containing protein [Pseudomonadales bacterium]
MTLYRQISLLTVVLIVVLLTGSLVVSVLNSRHYFEKQLYSHARDTATTLGVSISQYVQQEDWTKVNSMVDAIFDHGSYRSIVVVSQNQQTVADRQSSLRLAVVPAWFVRLIDLEVPVGESLVMNGWQQQGRVRIESHPEYAYLDLWTNAQQAFFWFFAVGIMTLGLLLYLMQFILRPLKAVEAQAAAICNKDFSFQQPLPRTRELRRTVQAMNRMAYQLKVTFDEQVMLIDQVREQNYKDFVTGLGNDLFFTSRYQGHLEAPEESTSGAVLILRINGLSQYNEVYGRAAGDQLLRQVSKYWQKNFNDVQGNVIARRSGADFIAWLPNVSAENAEAHLHAAYDSIIRLSTVIKPLTNALEASESSIHINMGLAYCDVGGNESELLSEADLALRQSQNKGQSGVSHSRCGKRQNRQNKSSVVETDNAETDNVRSSIVESPIHESDQIQAEIPGVPFHLLNLSIGHWQNILQEALVTDGLIFYSQPILRCQDSVVIYHEVLLRLEISGDIIRAGDFIPYVERLGLSEVYDRHIIEKLLRQLQGENTVCNRSYCVNLSPQSILMSGFVEWLILVVRDSGDIAQSLIFEVSECSLVMATAQVQALAVGLKVAGARMSVDHFGGAKQCLSYLGDLPLYSIKVDHSYIRDIGSNRDHQLYVQSLLRVAHSRDIIMTAESVEMSLQWEMLKDFGVDGAQGHFLGLPTPL